ncbi:AAA family ATPase [Allofrancisella guangzhouensis]|uniref:division plane positioning ATPase MipZ n=1 Tax=Allofrancisella guangzhouensis TaxID=594679 RepID=UPI0019039E70|nr:division plane positioning ATPase MipZ [Allofrancisella guangzhouensis]MBK2027416.1 AAA family ATPase [Allofrancisella guangzhouensis]MBK2044223.1 AAA family ATPase [Allofrancisella guangzhouensis]MBK2045693.1 AAA family ATPase [Allofrancisella guangzhouensis]
MSERGTIIGVLSPKGGSGKSTLVENIAVGLAHKGVNVAIIDCDYRQRTVSKWISRRNRLDEDLPKIHCFLESDNLVSSIKEHSKHYDVNIIDVQGRDNKSLRAGFLVCDIIYIPFIPSQHDLEVLEEISILIEETNEQNPNRKIFAILNDCPPQVLSNQNNEAYNFLEDYKNILNLSSVKIVHRAIYQTCPAEGKGVIEAKDKKAINEINNIIKEIEKNV